MNSISQPWDYLIVTASSDAQAKAYEHQLAARAGLGLLNEFRTPLVVADPQGKRVGSGGSTLYCLLKVLERERPDADRDRVDWAAIERILAQRRILILHAGGDSRRLPAYGPCGKIFVPVPGGELRSPNAKGSGPCFRSESPVIARHRSRKTDQTPDFANLPTTVFDHLLATFTPFPAPAAGQGQVVVAAGDALLRFDARQIRLASEGMTALGCPATPDEAKKHGVFCAAAEGAVGPVRLVLQKPSLEHQRRGGAICSDGLSILDVGVMSFGADFALRLLRTFGIVRDNAGRLAWPAAMHDRIFTQGLDFYREICCCLGSEATVEHLVESARASGSTWDDAALAELFAGLHPLPLSVQVVTDCRFLHFGTTRQLVASGLELLDQMGQKRPVSGLLAVNSAIAPGATIRGRNSWVEGCRIGAAVELSGDNMLVGADIHQPLHLPEGACLDVLTGRDRHGQAVWFVRCYGIGDTFKDSLAAGGTLCGRPLADWLTLLHARREDLWPASIPDTQCSLWDARVFPAVSRREAYRDWCWMFSGDPPTDAQAKAFLAADRYSVAEIAAAADQDEFHARRMQILADTHRDDRGPASTTLPTTKAGKRSPIP